MTVEGVEWWAVAWLGGVGGRDQVTNLRRFRKFFLPFFQGFFALQVVDIQRLVATREMRGDCLGFTLLSYCGNILGSPTNPQ